MHEKGHFLSYRKRRHDSQITWPYAYYVTLGSRCKMANSSSEDETDTLPERPTKIQPYKFESVRQNFERSRVRIPAGTAGEFSSPGSTFCSDSYFGILPPPCYHKHVKNPGHSAKSAGGRLQLNTHTPYVCGFYWTVLRHWSQLVPNMSNDIWGH